MRTSEIVRLGSLKSVSRFKDHLRSQGINIPCDNELAFEQNSPLRQVLINGKLTLGNRIAVQPMEGWDGTRDGRSGCSRSSQSQSPLAACAG